LALEALARATLANVHPVLLADPLQEGNILYAFGYHTTEQPRSVKAKTVFTRCKTVVKDFTEQEFKFCMSLAERRNQELHTGVSAFEDFPSKLWLADYFRICKLLLPCLGLTLSHLFGREEALSADKMIEAAEKQHERDVYKLIADAKKSFEALSPDNKLHTKAAGSLQAQAQTTELGKLATCPSCEAQGLLSGEKVSLAEPVLAGDQISQETVALPTEFACFSCGLRLRGYSAIHQAQLGGQYTIVKYYDPMEYYNPYEEEYNNE